MGAADQFVKIWGKKLAKTRTVLTRLSRDLGNEALLFFNEQYKKAKTPDNKDWVARKDSKNNRALLVRSGRLRKSIRIKRSNQTSILIGTDVPYAKYHNAGSGKIPQRKFLGSSAILIRRLRRIIQAKISTGLK